MKFSRQLVVSSLAVVVLAACSGDPAQRRQAKNDFDYLSTPPLRDWKMPEGAEPEFYPNYDIPQGDYHGQIGKQVDIRPPQQVLELIPGARKELIDGEVAMWLLQEQELDKVWQVAQTMLQEQSIGIREQTDSRIVTDWVSWSSEDEEHDIGSRYEMVRANENNRYGFKISLIDWREDGEVKPVSRTNRERYNVLMTNLVTARYDTELREEAARKAEQLVKHIQIAMGSDRSGFPVIIARAPYNVFWRRVPELLPAIGFTLEELNQSQGTVKAKYAAPDDDFWQSVGLKPIALTPGSYTFQLGDLGNRTSINMTDKDGKPVEELLLKDLVPVIAAIASDGESAAATK
ncbi:outer membrane protein assembly factor BamC [Vibrio sp.]|uniref:outer membrane protein assembly factor BamC n=1 Tax=Vibrio sp. TaxID=678 RepID=UPI003D0EE01C